MVAIDRVTPFHRGKSAKFDRHVGCEHSLERRPIAGVAGAGVTAVHQFDFPFGQQKLAAHEGTR